MPKSKSFGYFLIICLFIGLFIQEALAQDKRSPAVRATEALHELWRSSGVPGVSMAMAYKGELVYSESLGYADLENLVPATPSTVYNIGSISKIMTAVAIMQLVEEEKINLDDSVRKYVPGYPDKGRGITIRQIMTHTSGIRHYRANEQITKYGPYKSFDEALDIFKNDSLLFKPVSYYHYSSFGVNLLQGFLRKLPA